MQNRYTQRLSSTLKISSIADGYENQNLRISPRSYVSIKRMGHCALCIDYRELNQRTATDRHPLPRVQTTLENLGGSAWFSLLDQGKAYQRFHTPKRPKEDCIYHPMGSL